MIRSHKREVQKSAQDINLMLSFHIETVVLLPHNNVDSFISVKMEYEDGVDKLPERVTYSMIQDYIEEKYGFKVHTANSELVVLNLDFLLRS